ncbi:MAG: trypsin-like peptidase domain-containing protein [Polyangia bacterium]
MKIVIEVLDGGRAGQRHTFDTPRSVRFGRHPDNDVAFDPQTDRDASSRHAELRLAMSGYRLFDLGSANGTHVDGKRVGEEGTLITGRAELLFGAVGPRVRVEVVDEARGAIPVTLHREGGVSTEPDAPATAREPTSPAPRRYGAGTVAGIVDDALRRSQTRTRKQLITLGVLSGVLAAGVATTVTIMLRSRPALMRRELSALVDAQKSASEDERVALQGKIDELARKLGRGVEIPRTNHGAVFLLASRGASGADGFCTAFAVTRRRLLTNAHCVQLADELKRRGNKIEIIPNGGGRARPVVAWRRSAGFVVSQNRIGADVGWVEVDDDLPVQVQLASPEVVQAVSAGDAMSTYGFPGRLSDSGAPEATYVTGVIGRVTTLDGRPGERAQQQLLQHSAYTSAGTSGSPLFDGEGRVIGINAGGYVDDSAAGRALPGYNFGMRIDLAEALLKEADQ